MSPDTPERKVWRDLAILLLVIGSWIPAGILASLLPTDSVTVKLGAWGVYVVGSLFLLRELDRRVRRGEE